MGIVANQCSLMQGGVKRHTSPFPCVPFHMTGMTTLDNVFRTSSIPEHPGDYGEIVILAEQNDENVHLSKIANLSASSLNFHS